MDKVKADTMVLYELELAAYPGYDGLQLVRLGMVINGSAFEIGHTVPIVIPEGQEILIRLTKLGTHQLRIRIESGEE